MKNTYKLVLAAFLLLAACDGPKKPETTKPATIATTTADTTTDTNINNPTGVGNNQRLRTPITPTFGTGAGLSLAQFLAAPILPEEVYNLWKIGFQNYEPTKPLAIARRQASNLSYGASTKGGRSGDWIKETLGKSENELTNELKTLSPPPFFTIEQIKTAYEEAKLSKAAAAGIPTFYLVEGVGINYLQDVPLGNNAIVQLASQFNFLESQSKNIMKVGDYLGDKTQGPQGVIEALAATLYRDALVQSKVPLNKITHALVDILPTDHASYYQNGYLMLGIATEARKNEFLAAVTANIEKLRILPQWVMCEPSGSTQLQVFSAAPSFQGVPANELPTIASVSGQISNALVSAQYEAIGRLAVIRAIATNKPVPVHLTLVGQGAFNNPAEVMVDAFKKVAEAVKGYPVKVYIHAFKRDASDTDNKKIVIKASQASAGTYTLEELAKDKFEKQAAE